MQSCQICIKGVICNTSNVIVLPPLSFKTMLLSSLVLTKAVFLVVLGKDDCPHAFNVVVTETKIKNKNKKGSLSPCEGKPTVILYLHGP